jgi:putative oxidoreductase
MTTHSGGALAPLFRPVRALYATLERVPLSLMQLLMRIGIGSVFLNAGLLKYRSWELTLLLFRDEYKVPLADPALMARVATFNELVFSTLLIVGLGTRLATLPFFGMIVTIQLFVYPNAWVEHLVWTSILLVLLTRGGGTLSIDHLFVRRLGAAGVTAAAEGTLQPN